MDVFFTIYPSFIYFIHSPMRNSFLHYLLFSRNRALYRQLAAVYGTTGWNVYRIAHGKRIRSLNESRISWELRQKGIIG